MVDVKIDGAEWKEWIKIRNNKRKDYLVFIEYTNIKK